MDVITLWLGYFAFLQKIWYYCQKEKKVLCVSLCIFANLNKTVNSQLDCFSLLLIPYDDTFLQSPSPELGWVETLGGMVGVAALTNVPVIQVKENIYKGCSNIKTEIPTATTDQNSTGKVNFYVFVFK